MSNLVGGIVMSRPVAEAVQAGRPVVALESTIFSELGLPRPYSVEALTGVTSAIEAADVVPAVTAVIDGRIRCGIDPGEWDTICGPARKAGSAQLGMAVAQRWPYGATTVSASLAIAAATGISVFATGGIGGVHRNAAVSGDISADLNSISRFPVVTVTAGAKVFLDLPRTVEYLETLGVPVVGWGCHEFPAFHARSSGVPIPLSTTDPGEVAAMALAHRRLGGGGIVVANPIPEADAIDRARLEGWVDEAMARTGAGTGGAVTPAVLTALAEISDGRTVAANLSLAENNARVAATIARALAEAGAGA